MTRLERYEQKLATLEGRRSQMLRKGRYVDVQMLDSEIEEAKALIREAKDYQAKPVLELLSREEIQESGLVALLIESHLAADFLADICFRIEQVFKERGLQAVSIVPDIKDLLKRSNIFASILCLKNAELSSLLIDNEDLIGKLHSDTLGYIKERLE